MNNEISYEQIKDWILRNGDDVAAMDWINKVSYQFSSKFQAKINKG